jgi:enamine deaminase RidA (YjgF/YER057c/UK114 family)
MKILLPEGWPHPSGYANGVLAEGRMLFVSGMIGWDAQQRFTSESLAGQVRQVLENIVAVLAAGGARPEHLVRLTWYVVDRQAYLDARKEIGAAWREVIGRHYPAMSVVEVNGLLEPQALVEIEATAVIPSAPCA